MNKYLFFIVLLALVWGCSNPSDTEKDNANIPLASELTGHDDQWEMFLSWWPGEYDNLQQVKRLQEAADNPEEVDVPAMVLHIRRVDLPVFGDDVYYAEWQKYGAPNDIVRQRFYAFRREGPVFRLYLHIFPFDNLKFRDKTAGAYLDPAKLKGITPSDMTDLPGCDVYFDWSDKEFAGAMRENSCRFPAPDTGTPIYSWSQMRLQMDSFQYLDGWFNEDGSYYYQFTREWIAFDKKTA